MEFSTWVWAGPAVGAVVGAAVAGIIQIMFAGQRIRSKDREELSAEWQGLFRRQQQDIDRQVARANGMEVRLSEEQNKRHDCELRCTRLSAEIERLREDVKGAGIRVTEPEEKPTEGQQ